MLIAIWMSLPVISWLVAFFLPDPVCWLVAAVAFSPRVLLDVAWQDWVMDAVDSLVLLMLLWLWYRNRRDGARALREIGEKSRARLAALVRSVREHAIPRPVPVPA